MDESRLRRPLPSVGIPLLPEERRAARLRAVAAVGGSLLVIALLTGGAVALSVFYERDPVPDRDGARASSDEVSPPGAASPSPAEGSSAPASQPNEPSASGASPAETASPEPRAPARTAAPRPVVPAEPEVTPEGLLRTEIPFGRAGSFQTALANAGLSNTESNEVVRALRGVLDFRRCRPEHVITVERRGGTRDLHTVRYRGGALLLVEVTRDARGRYRGRRVPVPVQRRHVTAGGRVTTNLGDALEASNLRRSLGGLFAEVFSDHLEVNGGRRGDAFRVVVDEEWVNGEFLRYGTVWALEYTDQRGRTARAFYFAPPAEAGATVDPRAPRPGEYYDESGFTMRRRQLAVPLRYDHISSPFDPRRMHPILRRIEPHNGVDYSAAPGTPVWAAADGVVTWAADRGANGNLVVIRHGAGLETSYAHLLRFGTGIRSGVTVTQRQVIGYVGSTGRSTGPHLHYGVRLNGRWVDPLAMPRSSGRPVPRPSQRAFASHARALRAELARIRVPPAPPTPPAPVATPTPPPARSQRRDRTAAAASTERPPGGDRTATATPPARERASSAPQGSRPREPARPSSHPAQRTSASSSTRAPRPR
ncbi:MAG: peptidoglycan DD-metalloendopeptidase family protein [Deltaproteobacteria bacterium]|nr:peptidoglycan DD-metalloendopeptidase family protein [Deltaproteobacteria bacterium]